MCRGFLAKSRLYLAQLRFQSIDNLFNVFISVRVITFVRQIGDKVHLSKNFRDAPFGQAFKPARFVAATVGCTLNLNWERHDVKI
jgi:hypothetical protein